MGEPRVEKGEGGEGGGERGLRGWVERGGEGCREIVVGY